MSLLNKTHFKFFTFISIIELISASNAIGAYCRARPRSECSGSLYREIPLEANNCQTSYYDTSVCYKPSDNFGMQEGNYTIYYTLLSSCQTCKPGYTMVSISKGYTADQIEEYLGFNDMYNADFLCTQWDSSGNTLVDFATCECICDGDCTTINWRPITTEYEQMTEKNCVCDGQSAARCETTEHYRCAAGYYGQSTENTKPTCTKCPTLLRNDGVENPGTSSVGATSITNCYQPQNIEFTDDKGIYTFNGGNCYNTGN